MSLWSRFKFAVYIIWSYIIFFFYFPLVRLFNLPFKPVGFVSLPLQSEPTVVLLTTITTVVINATIVATTTAMGWEPVGVFEIWWPLPPV